MNAAQTQDDDFGTKLAAEVYGDSGKEKGKPESQATQIVKLALAEGADLFHNPAGEAFATLPIDGRRETWPLRTKTVRRWLARLFYLATEQAPGSEGIQTALGVLEGKALFDGAEHPVHLRAAEHDGAALPRPRRPRVAGGRDHAGRLAGGGRSAGPLPPCPRDAAAADSGRRRLPRGAAALPQLRLRGRLPADGRLAGDGAAPGRALSGAGPSR